MRAPGRLLALDTGSPLVSVALAIDGEVRATRAIEQASSAEGLIGLLDSCLAEAGLRPPDLDAVAVLQGPGSFTGLRVGLSTVLGLRQALGLPVAVLPSLAVLAAAAPPGGGTVVPVVDALRGEWFAQQFSRTDPPRQIADARILKAAELAALAPSMVIGFGVERLRDELPGVTLVPATPLAATAARLAPLLPEAWDASLLVRPLYLREPAVTPSAR